MTKLFVAKVIKSLLPDEYFTENRLLHGLLFFAAIYLAKITVFNGTSVHKEGEKGIFSAISVFSRSNDGRRNGLLLDNYSPACILCQE